MERDPDGSPRSDVGFVAVVEADSLSAAARRLTCLIREGDDFRLADVV
jgi:hypothetical protein